MQKGETGMRTQHAQLKKARYRTGRRRWLLPVMLFALLAAGAWYLYPRMQPVMAQLLLPQREAQMMTALQHELPGDTWYALQLGAFEDEASAGALAESYQSRGAGGCIVKWDGRWCVLAAAYGSREDALRVQENLRAYHQVETTVTTLSRPGVTVQLSGTEDQVENLTAAYDYLCAMADEWQQMAMQLDSGAMDRKDAKAVLASHLRTAKGLRDALMAAFGAGQGMHPMAAQAALLLEGASQALQRAMDAEGIALFGAQVKLAQLQVITGLRDYAQQLLEYVSSP